MSITITDAALLAKLSEGPAVELKNEAGEVIGQFFPSRSGERWIHEFGVTVEEMEREIRDPNTKWVTPDEVMARLREIDRCTG